MTVEAAIDLLKPPEVSRRLRVSRSWLYAAAADGRIPSIRLGGSDGPLRFIPQELERWIREAQAACRATDAPPETLRQAAELARR